jgi:hypothetical protein
MQKFRLFKSRLAVALTAIALIAVIVCPQFSHADIPDEILIEKTCRDLFPNLISDFFARRGCINSANKEKKEEGERKKIEQARQQREEGARPCIADDLPRMERLLTRIEDGLKSEIDLALREPKNNTFMLEDISKTLKEIWPEMVAGIAPAQDNIRERVLIANLRTKCDSDFHFLINVRASADGSVSWFRAWPQSAPQGYQRETLQSGTLKISDYLDFDAMRTAFTNNALRIEAERELLSREARPGFPGFLADPKTACKVWDPFPVEGEKVTWSGRCVDGLAEGEGTVIYLWGGKRQLVTGMFSKGKEADGAQTTVEADGSVQSGIIKDGKLEGRLIQKYSNGSMKFNGEAASGKKSGFGVYYWLSANNVRYEGFFKDGMANGRGSIFSEAEGKTTNYSVNAKDGCLWSYSYGWNYAGAIDKTEGQCLAEGYP